MEILHNFTLVHDDVMDHSELRRGKPTVHKRWNPNIAILSGDELVALAYRSLLKTDTLRLKELLGVFTESFVEVCEGQALDKEFEIRRDVSLEEYLLMIGKKTGRMIAAASEIGGLVGGGTPREVAALRAFGEHLGRAFQIRDDLLDVVGTEQEFGKTIGSDIRERKKTYLFVTAVGRARGGDRSFLNSIRTRNGIAAREIDRVRTIYLRTGALDDAARAIERSTARAQESLNPIKPGRGKELLLWLSHRLLDRAS
jgi:geranylgeranyl diphosphate synthase type II